MNEGLSDRDAQQLFHAIRRENDTARRPTEAEIVRTAEDYDRVAERVGMPGHRKLGLRRRLAAMTTNPDEYDGPTWAAITQIVPRAHAMVFANTMWGGGSRRCSTCGQFTSSDDLHICTATEPGWSAGDDTLRAKTEAVATVEESADHTRRPADRTVTLTTLQDIVAERGDMHLKRALYLILDDPGRATPAQIDCVQKMAEDPNYIAPSGIISDGLKGEYDPLAADIIDATGERLDAAGEGERLEWRARLIHALDDASDDDYSLVGQLQTDLAQLHDVDTVIDRAPVHKRGKARRILDDAACRVGEIGRLGDGQPAWGFGYEADDVPLLAYLATLPAHRDVRPGWLSSQRVNFGSGPAISYLVAYRSSLRAD